MADISIKINSVCAAGNHINLTATMVTDAGKTVTHKITVTRSEILNALQEDPEQIILMLVRNYIRENCSGLTLAQTRTAIESKVWKI